MHDASASHVALLADVSLFDVMTMTLLGRDASLARMRRAPSLVPS
jgi:hypothetical protein